MDSINAAGITAMNLIGTMAVVGVAAKTATSITNNAFRSGSRKSKRGSIWNY